MKLFTIILLSLFMVSCENVLNEEIIYKISKGNHYPDNFIKYTGSVGHKMVFTIELDSSCYYTRAEPASNKAYGFSANYMNPKKYSCRITWGCDDKGQLYLGYLVHINGSTDSHYCIPAQVGKKYLCSIDDQVNNFFIIIDSNYYVVKKDIYYERKVRELPYFGGYKPAPHDVYIIVKELN